MRKTTRLYGTLLRDPRVALWRKVLFIGAIIIFGLVLIIPDSILIGLLGVALPVAGPVFGIPAGITADVAALAVVLYAFLRLFFPKQIVQEHAEALYGPILISVPTPKTKRRRAPSRARPMRPARCQAGPARWWPPHRDASAQGAVSSRGSSSCLAAPPGFSYTTT